MDAQEDNKEVLLSIITVTWNNLEGLKKTANSINTQTARNQIQWVVIDGKSNDGSVEFIKQHTSANDYWVSEKDRGLYDAMNKGLKAAKGTFLWFLNAGDVVFADNIVQLLNPYFANADLIFGETMLTLPDGSNIGTRSEHTTRKLPQHLTLQSMLGGMIVNHQSVIVKKSYCPEFDLTWKIAADYDWLCTILEQDIKTKNSWLVHSGFELGGLSSKKKWASWKERFRIMKKHFGLLKTLKAHITIVFRAVL
ncbi:MAG: glycosyltransferase [Bacteroidia bacterium]|nr:glycosyltransferase [Bacteroidia bacterium]